jgi:uncharacterized protein (DUF1330 family)
MYTIYYVNPNDELNVTEVISFDTLDEARDHFHSENYVPTWIQTTDSYVISDQYGREVSENYSG